MYTCEFCQRLQAAGVPLELVPVETRSVTYPLRREVLPPLPVKRERLSRRHRLGDRRDDPGGQGYETVRELRCCPACSAEVGPARIVS